MLQRTHFKVHQERDKFKFQISFLDSSFAKYRIDFSWHKKYFLYSEFKFSQEIWGKTLIRVIDNDKLYSRLLQNRKQQNNVVPELLRNKILLLVSVLMLRYLLEIFVRRREREVLTLCSCKAVAVSLLRPDWIQWQPLQQPPLPATQHRV